MEYLSWRNRITNRSDMAARITHLTRGADDEGAFEKLWKILCDKTLIGSGKNGYIVGDTTAVCFQEIPLSSIAENLLYEETLHDKVRYSWFGLRFNKVQMYSRGARPVIYGDTEELKSLLPSTEYWRIVNLNLAQLQDIIDWSHEREWRIKGNFTFKYCDIEILVKDDTFYRRFVTKCFEENKTSILREVHGITMLNTVLS